jgi:ATP-dependent DNA helicase RecG
MAPTEVLASQHWSTLEKALAHSRVNRLLLTGNLTKSQRRRALEQIAAGDVQLVVGTQAVIQKDVRFRRLGLAVIDEQHKFGVMQRAHFSSVEGAARGTAGDAEAAPTTPHVLVMTATPIPRSLCLTRFGDLDVTAIREMPPGRQKVLTSRITHERERLKAWEFVRSQLAAGRQAYVVFPRIEAKGPASETASAEHMHQVLSGGELKGFKVGLLHGQMDQQLKTRIMTSFRDGRLSALAATTVIEVGIDVPNATLLVVYEAERFGLSQLHQLRGRIGRGKFQGYCFLFSETESPEAAQRLEALVSSADGFRIAEADFQIRGPGDVLGTRQHGELPLRVADLTVDEELLLVAREQAFGLVDSGRFDDPEFAPLKVRVLERFGGLMELPHSG